MNISVRLFSKSTILWVLSGVLMGIPFMHSWLWMCGVLGVALFIYQSIKQGPSKVSLYGALLAMSIKYALVLSWGWSAYPLTWIHLPAPWIEILFLGLYFVVVSCVLASPFIIVSWSIHILYKKGMRYLVILPFVWVVAEVIGSYIYSVLLIGPGIAPNVYFSFGYIGYLLAVPEGFLFLAKFGGVYAMTIMLISIALGLLYVTQSTMQTFLKVGIALLFIMFASGTLGTSLTQSVKEEVSNVVVIDTRFPAVLFQQPGGYSKKEEAIKNAVQAALAKSPDIIILPEDSRFTGLFTNTQMALAALQMAKQRDVVLIDSSRVVDERGKTVVRGYIYDTENNKVYYIDKQYLAPQGEFMPYVVRAVLHFVPKSTWKQNILKQLSYETGEVNTLAETSTGLPNVLFCMESISPISVRQLLQKHPSAFIAHPVSHTWFSDSSILRQQL
jgi:apolipoprotein N-acyltransferase